MEVESLQKYNTRCLWGKNNKIYKNSKLFNVWELLKSVNAYLDICFAYFTTASGPISEQPCIDTKPSVYMESNMDVDDQFTSHMYCFHHSVHG